MDRTTAGQPEVWQTQIWPQTVDYTWFFMWVLGIWMQALVLFRAASLPSEPCPSPLDRCGHQGMHSTFVFQIQGKLNTTNTDSTLPAPSHEAGEGRLSHLTLPRVPLWTLGSVSSRVFLKWAGPRWPSLDMKSVAVAGGLTHGGREPTPPSPLCTVT